MINKSFEFTNARNIIIKIILLIILFFLFAPHASGHQPRLVTGSGMVIIDEPEISKAYYGTLSGSPARFSIKSDVDFELYVSLLLPIAPGAADSVSAKVTDVDGNEVALLDGESAEWELFYEPFAGDDYNQGPEFTKDVPAGTYTIEVFNEENSGKYVISTGKIESFPLHEIIHTAKVLPKLKADFFGKPAYTAYFNLTGLFLGITLLFIILVILAVTLTVRRYVKKHK